MNAIYVGLNAIYLIRDHKIVTCLDNLKISAA